MTRLHEFVAWLARVMNAASAVLLIAMVAVTLADITTRTLFAASHGAVDLTFRGGVELISTFLLLMVFLTFPHSIRQAQVVVEMFTDRFGPRVVARLDGLYTLGLGVLAATLAWRFHDKAAGLAATGETTQDLHVPLSLLAHVVSVAAALLAVRALLAGIGLLTTGREVTS